jgi:hypothetical protein
VNPEDAQVALLHTGDSAVSIRIHLYSLVGISNTRLLVALSI